MWPLANYSVLTFIEASSTVVEDSLVNMMHLNVLCHMCNGTGGFRDFSSFLETVRKVVDDGWTCPICLQTSSRIETFYTHLVGHTNTGFPQSSSGINGSTPNGNEIKPEKVLTNGNDVDELDQILKDFTEIVCSDNTSTVSQMSPNPSLVNADMTETSLDAYSPSSVISQRSPKPIQCPKCAWNFDNEDFLGVHMMLMHSEKSSRGGPQVSSFPCKVCSEVSESADAYKTHLLQAHEEDLSVCPHCAKTFKLKGSLLVHMKVVHNNPKVTEENHNCRVCGKNFENRYRRNIHEKRHNRRSSLFNSKRKNTDRELNGSSISEPSVSKVSCEKCSETFDSQTSLLMHSVVHMMENPSTAVQTSSSAKEESSKALPPNKWECQVCHKTFTTKYFLKKHHRLHTGETPYSCELCGRSFTFQQSYHKHMLYHSDEKPYKCEECGRAFKELSTLQNHERIHSGERPFACETCGKSFRQRVSYLVHRRIHTGATPYSCAMCGKKFRYKITQRTHKCQAAFTAASEEIEMDPALVALPPDLQRDLRKIRIAKSRKHAKSMIKTPNPPSAISERSNIGVEHPGNPDQSNQQQSIENILYNLEQSQG